MPRPRGLVVFRPSRDPGPMRVPDVRGQSRLSERPLKKQQQSNHALFSLVVASRRRVFCGLPQPGGRCFMCPGLHDKVSLENEKPCFILFFIYTSVFLYLINSIGMGAVFAMHPSVRFVGAIKCQRFRSTNNNTLRAAVPIYRNLSAILKIN